MYDAAFGPQADGDPNDPTGQLRHMGYLAQMNGMGATGTGGPATQSSSSNALVGQAQTELNRIGFGPLEVDGILGPNTSNALRAFYATKNQSWNGQVTQATVAELIASGSRLPAPRSAPPVATTPAPAQPFYKSPTFIVLAVAGIGTAAYLMWRAGDAAKGALAGDDDEPEHDEGRRGPGRPKKPKVSRAKCAIGDDEPSWTSAKPVSLTSKLPPIPGADPVE
jgi:peptidoglycan hydrolase-like protein with peptidoglycan-binding domain